MSTEQTERTIRKGKKMAVETTTKVTCDGCGKTQSVVHEAVTEASMQQLEPWYRIAVEFQVRRPIGQSPRDVRLDHGPVQGLDPRIDACSQECVHKALAKIMVPPIVAAAAARP